MMIFKVIDFLLQAAVVLLVHVPVFFRLVPLDQNMGLIFWVFSVYLLAYQGLTSLVILSRVLFTNKKLLSGRFLLRTILLVALPMIFVFNFYANNQCIAAETLINSSLQAPNCASVSAWNNIFFYEKLLFGLFVPLFFLATLIERTCEMLDKKKK